MRTGKKPFTRNKELQGSRVIRGARATDIAQEAVVCCIASFNYAARFRRKRLCL